MGDTQPSKRTKIEVLTPFDLLQRCQQNKGKVVVLLRNDTKLEARIRGFDQHINLVLYDCVEFDRHGARKDLSKIVLRGDNVVAITTK